MVEGRYDLTSLHRLHPRLQDLQDLPYTSDTLLWESSQRADKLSIQGVQPKLSARLNLKDQTFELVDSQGHFILKPQNPRFRALPENEDLTMKLARLSGLEVPDHGLVYGEDEVLTYWIRRFDRIGRNQKISMEDFAQLLGQTRDTKYESSLEEVAGVVRKYCTFPVVELAKLLKLVIFNFICGNEDQHLKNFSLIGDSKAVRLSPSYDLLNSTIILKKARDETALPLRDKQRDLDKEDLLEYYGKEVLSLQPMVIESIMRDIAGSLVKWPNWIDRSFLPLKYKELYLSLTTSRSERLDLKRIEVSADELEALGSVSLQKGAGGHQSFFKQLELQRHESTYCVTDLQFRTIQERQTGSGGWQTAYRILGSGHYNKLSS